MDINQWTAARDRRGYRVIMGVAFAVLGLNFIGLGAVAWIGHHRSPPAPVTEMAHIQFEIPSFDPSLIHDSRRPVSDQKIIAAFHAALGEWERVLNKTIDPPGLVDGSCFGELYSSRIACANVRGYEVIIQDLRACDPKTIFMHEIAHLLGVPHIEDDPLMNASYLGPIDHPTKFAIALAKEARGSPRVLVAP